MVGALREKLITQRFSIQIRTTENKPNPNRNRNPTDPTKPYISDGVWYWVVNFSRSTYRRWVSWIRWHIKFKICMTNISLEHP